MSLQPSKVITWKIEIQAIKTLSKEIAPSNGFGDDGPPLQTLYTRFQSIQPLSWGICVVVIDVFSGEVVGDVVVVVVVVVDVVVVVVEVVDVVLYKFVKLLVRLDKLTALSNVGMLVTLKTSVVKLEKLVN